MISSSAAPKAPHGLPAFDHGAEDSISISIAASIPTNGWKLQASSPTSAAWFGSMRRNSPPRSLRKHFKELTSRRRLRLSFRRSRSSSPRRRRVRSTLHVEAPYVSSSREASTLDRLAEPSKCLIPVMVVRRRHSGPLMMPQHGHLPFVSRCHWNVSATYRSKWAKRCGRSMARQPSRGH